jgi:hypothetical protein
MAISPRCSSSSIEHGSRRVMTGEAHAERQRVLADLVKRSMSTNITRP